MDLRELIFKQMEWMAPTWTETRLLAAATALGVGSGVAVAQTVSGGNPYEQGFAAGASAKEQNSFNAFDSGYRAGETAQSNSRAA